MSEQKKIGRPPTGAAKTPAERMAAMRARKAAERAAGAVTSKILDLSEVRAPKVAPPVRRPPGVTRLDSLPAPAIEDGEALRAKIEELEAQVAALKGELDDVYEMHVGTQLHAKIRASSQYRDQTSKMFAVSVIADSDGYIYRGGPGGRYRAADLHIFIVVEGKPVKIS